MGLMRLQLMRLQLMRFQSNSENYLLTAFNTMLAIQKTKEIAAYLRQLCAAELQSTDRHVPFPNWPIDLLEECHYAAKVIVQAIKNQSKLLPMLRNLGLIFYSERTKWSVMEYIDALKEVGPRCSGQQDKVENKLMSTFPPGKSTLISSPTVMCDQEGSVLAWYLPGILSPRRQVSGNLQIETK
jgi:hypothetical protein